MSSARIAGAFVSLVLFIDWRQLSTYGKQPWSDGQLAVTLLVAAAAAAALAPAWAQNARWLRAVALVLLIWQALFWLLLEAPPLTMPGLEGVARSGPARVLIWTLSAVVAWLGMRRVLQDTRR